MNRKQWIEKVTKLFIKKNIDAPKLSAELLLCSALKINRVELHSYPLKIIPNTITTSLNELAERRLKGEPLAYIFGKKEFFSREFYVNNNTLIPRPETELLIEFALTTLNTTNIHFMDAGTGSGCIAVTLCAEKATWKGFALDISYNALKVAQYNSQKYHTNKQITFIQGDLASTILNKESLDLYISNPPYISEEEYSCLPCEIFSFEPKRALVPSLSVNMNKENTYSLGIEAFKTIIYQAEKMLKKGGLLLIEHGATQHTILELLLKNNIWENILYHKDLSKKHRFISAYKAK